MALTPLSGSLTPPSSRNALPNDIPNSQDDLLGQMPNAAEPNLNKFAIDTSQYPNTTKSLVGFIKGKRVSVTYYRLLNKESSNIRTNIADLPTARNAINTEYQKIINLEITLPKAFEFTSNNNQANVSVQGQAVFYPNMNPNIGDIFLMGTGDNRIGLFRLSSVTPMSWRQDRIYIVNFTLEKFADNTVIQALEGSVTLTSIFSKENYLGGTAALLSEDTYLHLLKIKEMRVNLCKFYHQLFFDSNSATYLMPDGNYDPWVVQFMSNKLSMDDIPVRPKNLLGFRRQTYNQTLWARFEDRYNTTLYGIYPRYNFQEYNQTRQGTFVTELNNRFILYPSTKDTDPFYLFSEKFYTGNKNLMNAEELLFYNAITLRDAGYLATLITDYLDPVYTLTLENQFYKIPLYIHLIDMSLQSKYREIDAPSMSYAPEED